MSKKFGDDNGTPMTAAFCLAIGVLILALVMNMCTADPQAMCEKRCHTKGQIFKAFQEDGLQIICNCG